MTLHSPDLHRIDASIAPTSLSLISTHGLLCCKHQKIDRQTVDMVITAQGTESDESDRNRAHLDCKIGIGLRQSAIWSRPPSRNPASKSSHAAQDKVHNHMMGKIFSFSFKVAGLKFSMHIALVALSIVNLV